MKKQGAAWGRFGKGNWAVKLLWLGKWAMSSMEKAGLLQARGSQPHKCPGERRKVKLGSGKEGFVVSCFGISGLGLMEQSHPCCLSSNSCLQAGEVSQLQGMTEERGNLGVGKGSLACGSPREKGVCILSPLLNSHPTAALPKAGRMFLSPPPQSSKNRFLWKLRTDSAEINPLIYLSLISCGDIVGDSGTLQVPWACSRDQSGNLFYTWLLPLGLVNK